jgi:hypothetical protein
LASKSAEAEYAAASASVDYSSITAMLHEYFDHGPKSLASRGVNGMHVCLGIGVLR